MILRARKSGVSRFFIPAIDSSYTDRMLTLEKENPEEIFLMMGLHPTSVKENYKEELLHVKEWIDKRNFYAIGEIGIDLYWDTSFLKEQQYAKKKRLGIWEGDFVSPWDWRKGERLASQKPNEKNRCKIKGNISSSGEKIFHSPGGAYYSRTKISEQKGEKWFCSEAEAIKLGWRKSKR